MTNCNHDQQILGRLGNLLVKIAQTPEEIAGAQSLRHKVFFEERSGGTALKSRSVGNEKDEDKYDVFCDHLIVVETDESGQGIGKTVATYRLLSQSQAEKAGGFYTASEFKVSVLLERFPTLKFLELGRSCVLPEFRTKRTIELLWHGSWAYVRKHGYDVMFGCASLNGVEVEPHREALALLYEAAKADADWDVSGNGELVDLSALSQGNSNFKNAIRALPPLIKGYLRLGAMFASQAVIDRQFGTIDVLVLLPVSRLNPRYVNYYGENAERYS
jgi:putative hemolysin